MILSKTRSDRRDRRLCRFGVMLVICSLLVNMVCVPKAKAVVIDATAAFGAAAATAAINGTTATTLFTGMSTSAATTAMTTLMGEYATATGVAASGSAFAASIGASAVVTAAGALVIGAAAGYALWQFIKWLREEKGLEAGGECVNIGSPTGRVLCGGVELPDINSVWTNKETFPYAFYIYDSYWDSHYFYISTTMLSWDGTCLSWESSAFVDLYRITDGALVSIYKNADPGSFSAVNLALWTSHDILSTDGTVYLSACELVPILSDDFILSPNPEFQEIPQELPEGQVLKIDTGIESLSVDDPQAAADAIMQTAIDGALDPVVTVEADPTVTPDPSPTPDPDAPELPSNLGDLGAALTTRFPFSIPWDIARAIKLIAAPAKAPYWEVDFLAPIAYRLPEGWKGSTKIVLDFGQPEYEIIGIASRWTSTIGFCLALAAATKRFIWTA